MLGHEMKYCLRGQNYPHGRNFCGNNRLLELEMVFELKKVTWGWMHIFPGKLGAEPQAAAGARNEEIGATGAGKLTQAAGSRPVTA